MFFVLILLVPVALHIPIPLSSQEYLRWIRRKLLYLGIHYLELRLEMCWLFCDRTITK